MPHRLFNLRAGRIIKLSKCVNKVLIKAQSNSTSCANMGLELRVGYRPSIVLHFRVFDWR